MCAELMHETKFVITVVEGHIVKPHCIFNCLSSAFLTEKVNKKADRSKIYFSRHIDSNDQAHWCFSMS